MVPIAYTFSNKAVRINSPPTRAILPSKSEAIKSSKKSPMISAGIMERIIFKLINAYK